MEGTYSRASSTMPSRTGNTFLPLRLHWHPPVSDDRFGRAHLELEARQREDAKHPPVRPDPPSCEENDLGQKRHRAITRVFLEGRRTLPVRSIVITGYGSERYVLSEKRGIFVGGASVADFRRT